MLKSQVGMSSKSDLTTQSVLMNIQKDLKDLKRWRLEPTSVDLAKDVDLVLPDERCFP